MLANDKLVLALPKGRILEEVMPLVRMAGIEPEAAFINPDARQLRFSTNDPSLEIIRVRSVDIPTLWSHIRVATKYPEITKRYFAERGVQAECIKLNGAIELAPSLGLCRRIVDLVSTGSTLKANGLVEVEEIATITSRLAVNRTAMKTRPKQLVVWIKRFREAVDGFYS